ncbi:hypothetical protein [Aureimonas psammosilenae]|uniref:hypothetical protein n=1 Tax=Aureimonas psammosilenae TaxID=2495496 RepID=UPI0012608EC5|nr:hypothetical protein [Aureimonas psammosilenae]
MHHSPYNDHSFYSDPGMRLCSSQSWYPYEPQGKVRWRPSSLRKEVTKLYNAQSFMMWRYGQCFNTHLTILARPLGYDDHREFAAAMAPFNKEMGRWLRVSGEERTRRWKKRVVTGQPQPHLWMYVFENGVRRGLHVHQLCTVPKVQKQAFETHVRDWWGRQACLDYDPSAIFITFRHQSGQDALTRHTEWVRYIMKSADRASGLYDHDDNPRTYEEIFKLRPYPTTPNVYVPQMSGICHALSEKAQHTPIACDNEEYRFVSKAASGVFDTLFDGSELQEYVERHNTVRRRLLKNLSS